MDASRKGVRGAASASATGAGHDSADTTGARSLRRCRTSGVATPTTTTPHAIVRRARVLLKRLSISRLLSKGPCTVKEHREEARTACDMTFSRPLLVPLVLVALLAPAGTAVSAPADSGVAAGSGGAPAGPQVQSRGGGSVAPVTTEAGSASEADDSGDGGARGRASQEEEPTTPGGGEQESGGGDEGTGEGGEEQPADPDEPVEEPSDDGATGPAGDTPDGGGEAGATDSGYAFLPSTGLEVATLAVIGLGLVMLGSALFPRRRVAAGDRR